MARKRSHGEDESGNGEYNDGGIKGALLCRRGHLYIHISASPPWCGLPRPAALQTVFLAGYFCGGICGVLRGETLKAGHRDGKRSQRYYLLLFRRNPRSGSSEIDSILEARRGTRILVRELHISPVEPLQALSTPGIFSRTSIS